jgi:hypothetical protein
MAKVGKIGRSLKKNHSKFKSPRSRQVGTATLRMPGNSGFLSLQASAIFHTREQRLVVTVTGKKRPDNRGPGIFFRRTFPDWHRVQNADGSSRKKLDEVLKETAEKVQGRIYPEQGFFLPQCNPGGDDLAFLQKACSDCRCWYCELSEA